MYITGYENVVYRGKDQYSAIVHLVTEAEPGTMPTDGTDVEGLFPSHEGKDTEFLPGSDCLIAGTSKVKMLTDNLTWVEL